MSIQSVQRAAAILRCLATGSKRIGVSELSERLELAKGTIHGLLRTLQEEGFVEQDPESGKYQLGHALLELGTIYLDVSELRNRSLAWADLLATKSRESVRVCVLRGNSALVVHHAFRPDASLQILEVGSNLPLHATAPGKALLAFHRRELGSIHLSRLTKHTITALETLEPELQGIQAQGWALEREESVLSEAGLASPIFDHRGEVVGAIGITGSVSTIFEDAAPRRGLVNLVCDAARSISRELGGTWSATG
jgi:DNA-binding IclR family transcriptional regulator